MPSILRPKALRSGDVVAVAALSGGLEQGEASLFERGVEAIERMGFVVHVSPVVGLDRGWWWAAARPREVAKEFNRLLRDPEVRAIFALTGGRMTPSYLDLIDYGGVRADPKPLLGFSDISTLHLALHACTGLVSLHSELVTYGFGEWNELDDARRTELEDLYLRVLTSDDAPGPLPPGRPWESWRSGRAQGPLIGGLLNRLVRVQATPYALSPERFDGAILFWEEVGTSTAAIWNDLHLLRTAGVLDRIAGMVVGATEVELTEGGGTLREVVLDALDKRPLPVLGNVDIGHDGSNLPMPLGTRAEVDADARDALAAGAGGRPILSIGSGAGLETARSPQAPCGPYDARGRRTSRTSTCSGRRPRTALASGLRGSCCQQSSVRLYRDRTVRHPSERQTRPTAYVRGPSPEVMGLLPDNRSDPASGKLAPDCLIESSSSSGSGS